MDLNPELEEKNQQILCHRMKILIESIVTKLQRSL